ncbi:13350_t:CDS:2 [Funneliformis geosporum]|nr:13350_t:CDS:2 [Funneliformis geosporum]
MSPSNRAKIRLEFPYPSHNLNWILYDEFMGSRLIIQGQTVALKCLNNSQDLSSDYLNETHMGLFSQPQFLHCFGITQYPITGEFMIMLQYALFEDLRLRNHRKYNEYIDKLYFVIGDVRLCGSANRSIRKKEICSGMRPYAGTAHDMNMAKDICKGKRPPVSPVLSGTPSFYSELMKILDYWILQIKRRTQTAKSRAELRGSSNNLLKPSQIYSSLISKSSKDTLSSKTSQKIDNNSTNSYNTSKKFQDGSNSNSIS